MGGKGKGKGRGKRKEEDSASSSSYEESDDEQEKRMDPSLGEAKTFDQLARIYKGRKNRKELENYWKNECLILDQGSDSAEKPPSRKKGSGKGKSSAAKSEKEKKEEPTKKTVREGIEVLKDSSSKKEGSRGKKANVEASSSNKGKENARGEIRIDAESGSEVTFQELCEWYAGYSQNDLWDYWDSCWPVESKKKGLKAREKSLRDPYELRIDPSDGYEYTFEELRLYYRNEYDKKTIESYWEETCYLPKKSDKKGESKGGASSSKKELTGAHKRGSERNKAAPKERVRQEAQQRLPKEKQGPRPRLYIGKFANTQEIASASSKDGWWSRYVGDSKRNNSILVPGGREVYALSEAMHSEEFAPLPMGLRVRAESLGALLDELELAGGEGDFPGYAFAFLPGEADLLDSMLDALGIRRSAQDEAILDSTAWENDFTDQQMDSNMSEELSQATQMLKDFGETYELSFSEGVSCAPVLYFAQSDCSIDRPVLGVLHTRLWK